MMEAEVGVRPLLEGAMSQGIQGPLEAGEGRELILSQSLQKTHVPVCQHLNYSH